MKGSDKLCRLRMLKAIIFRGFLANKIICIAICIIICIYTYNLLRKEYE